MNSVGTMTWELSTGEKRKSEAYAPLNVLAHAEIFDIRLAQACGGQAECGTCRVRVVEGEVTPAVGDEVELLLNHKKSFQAGERLACRVRPRGDVVIALRGRTPPDLRDAAS